MTSNPRDAAIQVEVVKVSMSQSKEGYFLRLVLHPSDKIAALVNSPVGTRYVCAFVEVDDRQEPVAQLRARETNSAVAQSNLLCREPQFQEWLVGVGLASVVGEGEAAEAVRRYCGIESRSALASNEQALRLWKKLRTDFMDSLSL